MRDSEQKNKQTDKVGALDPVRLVSGRTLYREVANFVTGDGEVCPGR